MCRIAVVMGGCVTDFFTYETTKSVVVKSWSVGVINRIVQLLIITYFIGFVFIHEKAYQTTDTGIESSVMTKVKGFGHYNNRVMDVADYVVPPEGAAVFCIITKLIITEEQVQGTCEETGKIYECVTDADCKNHFGAILGNGVITGVCLNPRGNPKGRCEINGWCPAEDDISTVQRTPMTDVNNFTIFIKNSIRFPRFDVTRGNFLSNMTTDYLRNCTYDPDRNPFCPIFRVNDVLRFTEQNISSIAKYGGEIGINIAWKCNLDLDIEKCLPAYSFTRLDKPFEKNALSKGYNFRFAKYYKTENGTESRTLHKAFAIRFDILVTGNAGKFSPIPTLINLVAAFTSVGLGTVLCDVILLNFMKGADQYKAKKFEEVTEEQIIQFISQNPGSQLSIKREKSSEDSGACFVDLPV